MTSTDLQKPDDAHQHHEMGIVDTWQLLARTGAATRHLGQRADGRHQVALSNPATGIRLAMGSGQSVSEAIRVAIGEISG